MTSLGSALPMEMARTARLAVLCAGTGRGAIALDILSAIDAAARASALQDVLAMLQAHQALVAFPDALLLAETQT